MTLEQLKMLKLVADQGSLKAASARIFKTQAAISQGIKQLEKQLDIQLFDRQGYRLALTAQGEQIYQRALKLLEQASEIEQLSNHFAGGNEPSITLAFEASFDLTRVLAVLEMTQGKFPDTQIILRQEYLTGAINALQQEKADLVITPCDTHTLNRNNLDIVPLFQGTLINVAAPRLLMRHPNLHSVSELEKEYQIIVQDTGVGTQGVIMGVQDGQRCWYVNDFATKKTLALSGMGWGKLPGYLIKDDLKTGALTRLNLTDVENELKVNYYVLKQRSRLLGPVANNLWESLCSLAKKK